MHRQKQNGEADDRQSAAFILSVSVSKNILPAPRGVVVMALQDLTKWFLTTGSAGILYNSQKKFGYERSIC